MFEQNEFALLLEHYQIDNVSVAVTRRVFVSVKLVPTTLVLGPQLNCATVSLPLSPLVSHTLMDPSPAPLMTIRLSWAHTRLTIQEA